ncbi:MAG: sortase [bacterium]|nr:sortase [bacterium]
MKKQRTIPQSELIQLYRKALGSGVSIDKVDTKVQSLLLRNTVTQGVEERQAKERKKELQRRTPVAIRIGALVLPLVFLAVGLYLVGTAVTPIAGYYLSNWPGLTRVTLTSPIPNEEVLDVSPVVVVQAKDTTLNSEGNQLKIEPMIVDSALDYTNLSNWFNETEIGSLQAQENEADTYIINVPKLNIENAVVTVGGTDLNQSLIQYPGTALPGDSGAPVIFGHSVLRQFYNPNERNPRRYNSIFSTIMTLKKGDLIYVTHEDVTYTYSVQEKTEVKPEDTYILSQRYDSKFLKLVTCTPEGTYLRRGVVIAQLVQ